MSLILAINPGSTSTKIAVYDNLVPLFVKSIQHSSEEISSFSKISDQYHFRKEAIVAALKENNFSVRDMVVIVGRGGILKPVKSGVYEVNDAMIQDLVEAKRGEHASNLGGLIAKNLAEEAAPGCKAYIADPVVVDELSPVARVAGHPLFQRRSLFHALNQKAIAKMHAASVGKLYDQMNLIVAHLGGGVSIGAHLKGSVIDVNNALDGEGPFSPERSGTLPTFDVVKLCFSGKYTQQQIIKMLIGEGGIVAHLGTNAFYEVERRANEGDVQAKLISDAFAYNIAKAIGSMSVVLKGNVDAILITGGIANNSGLMDKIIDYVKFIAPVSIYPGEDEMGALAKNGFNILNGIDKPKIY